MPKTIELWRWMVTDPATGRRYTTRHRMQKRDALDMDPAAVRVEGTLEERQVPDDPMTALSASGAQRAPLSAATPQRAPDGAPDTRLQRLPGRR